MTPTPTTAGSGRGDRWSFIGVRRKIGKEADLVLPRFSDRSTGFGEWLRPLAASHPPLRQSFRPRNHGRNFTTDPGFAARRGWNTTRSGWQPVAGSWQPSI